jgi:hypothetical protein
MLVKFCYYFFLISRSDLSFSLDAESYRLRLDKIEIVLEQLKPQVMEQTKEIDELLDIYEKGVSWKNGMNDFFLYFSVLILSFFFLFFIFRCCFCQKSVRAGK